MLYDKLTYSAKFPISIVYPVFSIYITVPTNVFIQFHRTLSGLSYFTTPVLPESKAEYMSASLPCVYSVVNGANRNLLLEATEHILTRLHQHCLYLKQFQHFTKVY